MKKIWRVAAVVAALVLLGALATVAYAHKAASTGNVATPPSGTTYALVVGISDYNPPGADGPDLDYADDDAVSFDSALTTIYGVSPGNITVLIDTAATKDAITDWLTDAATSTTSADDVVVFVSGHGTRAFCPSGKVGNAILVNTESGLDVICDEELRNLMNSITAARKVVILDISFPWGFRNDFKDASNTLLITAARGEARESAFPEGDLCYPGRGIFTCWFVVRGILNGKANNLALNPHAYNDPDISGDEIPFEEAYDYVFHQVPPIQKPGIVDNVTEDFLPAD